MNGGESMSVPKIIGLIMLLVWGGVGGFMILKSLLNDEQAFGRRRFPWAWLAAIGGGGIIFLLLWFGFTFAELPGQYLRALKMDDPATAYQTLAPELQEELGGQRGFNQWVAAITPESWFFNLACSTGSIGRVDGSVKLAETGRTQASFHMRRFDEGWLIMGIEFWDLDRAYWVGYNSGLDCSD